MPSIRWPDDRLDELSRTVRRIEPVVTTVAVLESRMETLTRAVEANTEANQHVAQQLEQAQLEPVVRQRRIRDGIVIAVVSGSFCATLATILALIASHH